MIGCVHIPPDLVNMEPASTGSVGLWTVVALFIAVLAVFIIWRYSQHMKVEKYVLGVMSEQFRNIQELLVSIKPHKTREANMGNIAVSRDSFMNEVSREVDTEGTKINVAETRRVLKCSLDKLANMKLVDVLHIIVRH